MNRIITVNVMFICSTYSFPLSQAKEKIEVSYEDAEKLVVTKEDFEYALQYCIKPSFGIKDEIESYIRYGDKS